MKIDRKSQMSFTPRAALTATLCIASLLGCRRSHPPPTPKQEEQFFVGELVHSGSVPASLMPFLEPNVSARREVFLQMGRRNLATHGNPADLLSVGPISCFGGGCTWQLHFKDQIAAVAFEKNLLMGPTSPFVDWPGRVYRGPYLADPGGSIRTTWALLLDRARYKELITDRHAAMPDPAQNNNAISKLQMGDGQ